MKVNDFSTGIYEHYKGQKYLVLGLAKDAETHKMFVIYVTLYENEEGALWVRPYEIFTGQVKVDGKMVARFRYLGQSF